MSKILYLCDRRVCPNGCGEFCSHTTDIAHAVNFELDVEGAYKEKNQKILNFKRRTEMEETINYLSNLITDMTLKGTSKDELAEAIKYSMAVINAKKTTLIIRIN